MEGDPNQMSQSASLCRSGCGFYGNPSSDGLCSKCYKDGLKRKQAAPSTGVANSTATASMVENANNIKTLIASSSSSSTTSSPLPNSSSSSVSSNVSAITAQQESSQPSSHDKVGPADIVPGSLQHSSRMQVEIQLSAGQPKSIFADELSGNSSSPPPPLDSSSETPKKQKKKKLRCPICRSNLELIRFECRCGGFFCGQHRYANMHNCTFDYKEHGAEEIRKNNPQVIGEKIQKI